MRHNCDSVAPEYDALLLTMSRTWLDNDDGLRAIRHEKAIDALRRYARLLCPARPEPGGGPVLIHGDEPRGDRKMAEVWQGWGLPVDPHPAAWPECGPDCPPDRSCRRSSADRRRTFCAKAGHRRNAEMVALWPRYCVAFIRDKSSGATGCAWLAEGAGVLTERVTFP